MKCNHCQAEWNVPNSKLTVCPFCSKSLISEPEINDTHLPEQILERMFKKEGVNKDKKQLSSLLDDYFMPLPHERKTLRLLKNAAEYNIPAQLLEAKDYNESDKAKKIQILKQNFQEEYSLDSSRASYSVDCFAYALLGLPMKTKAEYENKKDNESTEKSSLIIEKQKVHHPAEPEMVFVQGGSFMMGATPEQGSDIEKPAHRVNVSDFYIGKYQVTQAQWKAVMGNNPSRFKGEELPVEQVSWNVVQVFISKLNALTGKEYRLPTEAEWEFAARGGNKTKGYKYSGSNIVENVAWYWDNSGKQTHPVGTKSPNELYIYDLSGNVLEWCSDRYGEYSSNAQTNPQGPNSGSARVFRGGSCVGYARSARISVRDGNWPGDSSYNLSFRLARSSK